MLTDKNRPDQITITRFKEHMPITCTRQEGDICVLVLDVETTGVSYDSDRVIQLALRPVFINPSTYEVSSIAGMKVFKHDPGIPIPQEVTDITGLTDADVAGEKIDWNWVASVVARVDFVLCHNAKFDRNFVMNELKEVGIGEPDTIWACSLRQIDWKNKCRPSAALEVLCAWHGFHYHAHDASADIDALLHLLRVSGRIEEVIENAKKSEYRVFAVNFPRDKNDILKSRRYRWDPHVRMWWAGFVGEELANQEAQWLQSEHNVEPQIFEIKPRYRFAS